jgi:hypothetical protein
VDEFHEVTIASILNSPQRSERHDEKLALSTAMDQRRGIYRSGDMIGLALDGMCRPITAHNIILFPQRRSVRKY